MREFEMCLKRTENEKWAVVYVVVDGAGVTICRGLSDGDLRCFGSRRRSFSGHPPRLDEAQNCAVAHTADSTTRLRPPSLTSCQWNVVLSSELQSVYTAVHFIKLLVAEKSPDQMASRPIITFKAGQCHVDVCSISAPSSLDRRPLLKPLAGQESPT